MKHNQIDRSQKSSSQQKQFRVKVNTNSVWSFSCEVDRLSILLKLCNDKN